MTDGRWFLERLPADAQLADLLGHDPVAALLETARSRAPVETGFKGEPERLADDPAVKALFELATAAAAKLRQDDSVTLSQAEQEALHAFVHLIGRPALRTYGGDLPSPPSNWDRLASDRSILVDVIRGVGRLDDASRKAIGTGWFVAKDLLITNNHVVAQLCGIPLHGEWRKKLAQVWSNFSDSWRSTPAQRPFWDPGDSPPEGGGSVGRVAGIRALHPEHDAALLDVEGVPDSADRVLPLADAEPKAEEGSEVYLAGYPAAWSGVTNPTVLQLLFGGPSDVVHKRVSPGRILEKELAEHDASTLGGSSGSPVVAFSDHRVRALHFRGVYGTANYAVPFWKLKQDPFLAANGIELEA